MTRIIGRLLAVVWPFLGIVLVLLLLGEHSLQSLAGARAYISGNNIWTVAQQQAVTQLRRYATTGDPAAYRAYLHQITVHRADRRAREAVLATPPDLPAARAALIEGRNAPADVEALIGFLQEYATFAPVREAVLLWLEGDQRMTELEAQAARLNTEIQAGRRQGEAASKALASIDQLDAGLQQIEREFGYKINDAARRLQQRMRWIRLGSALLLCLLGLLLSIRAVWRQLAVEQALRVSEERYAVVAESANDGIWEWDIGSGKLYCSPRVREMLGYSEQELGFAKQLVNIMPPDDFRRGRQQLMEHIEQRRHDVLSRSMRMRTRDGRTRWILARSVTRYDADGQPLRVAGSYTDITAQVENERRLRLAASVFEAAREGIVIADARDRIVSTNRGFLALGGHASGALAGRRVQSLLAPGFGRSMRREMARSLRDNGQWSGEAATLTASGETRPIELSIVAVNDEVGGLAYRIYVCRDIAERKYAQARIQHLAYFDPLTALPNRSYLGANFDAFISTARKHNQPLATVFFDLDGFKQVNDTLGHSAGDQLIRRVAQRLGEGIGEGDLLCRFGGDEFLLLLPGRDAAAVECLTADLLRRIGEPLLLEGRMLNVTSSAGYAMYPEDATDAESLVRDADMALYRAKEHGKNIVERYQTWMSAAVSWRHDMLANLRHALTEQQFQLRFQPVVDASSNAVAGVETLLYWKHPEMGVVSPNSFIPLAEESGLIEPIGEWLIDAALAQFANWRAAGLPRFYLAINLSGYQLRRAETFQQQFIEAVERHGIAYADVVLEITERQIVYDSHASLPVLDRLAMRGIGVSIDDFGTGYSSLEYLKDMPVTQIKIDKTFVHNLVTEVGDRAIVNAIIGLGRSLGVKVVAEGVENAEQLGVLRGYGCNLVQGYLYSPPLPAEELAAYVRSSVPVARG
ncbi:MAG TPA: bifunctional diguanylate cyclase/phosphodiesterase [Rhodanobacteraceae bacterium]|nr:bifunctional diguanylate cyclase/phosphodiesterase [Rhodanobacteraceae bacterium]